MQIATHEAFSALSTRPYRPPPRSSILWARRHSRYQRSNVRWRRWRAPVRAPRLAMASGARVRQCHLYSGAHRARPSIRCCRTSFKSLLNPKDRAASPSTSAVSPSAGGTAAGGKPAATGPRTSSRSTGASGSGKSRTNADADTSSGRNTASMTALASRRPIHIVDAGGYTLGIL